MTSAAAMVGGEEEEARAAAEGDSEFEGGRTDARLPFIRRSWFHQLPCHPACAAATVAAGRRPHASSKSIARSLRPSKATEPP